MASTPGMTAAVTLTEGPSMTCPRPPMHPVTTPPNSAGVGSGWASEEDGEEDAEARGGVKHSRAYAGASSGSS